MRKTRGGWGEPPPPFPSRARHIFALLVLIRPHYTIWEPGTGYLFLWTPYLTDNNIDGKNKQLATTFSFVFLYWKCAVENAGNGVSETPIPPLVWSAFGAVTFFPWVHLQNLTLRLRPFLKSRYRKGVPFLWKVVSKRVRDWTFGRRLPV